MADQVNVTYEGQTRKAELVAIGAGGGGSSATGPQPAASSTSVTPASNGSPFTTRRYQGAISANPAVALTTSASQIFASDANRSGVRVINPTAATVYLLFGMTGTPSASNYHDLIPPASGGLPSQWEPPFSPVGGIRAALSTGTGNVVTQDF